MSATTTKRHSGWAIWGLATMALLQADQVARAQGLLEVGDANFDVYIGPVVSIQAAEGDLSKHVMVLHEQGDQFTILSILDPCEVRSCAGEVFDAYWESPSCNGTPALVKLPEPQAWYNRTCSLFPLVLPDSLSADLWEVHWDQPVEVLIAGKRGLGSKNFGGPCNIESPHLESGYAVTLWGTLAPEGLGCPLRVRRNPFIFGDDFSSVDTGAWSATSQP